MTTVVVMTSIVIVNECGNGVSGANGIDGDNDVVVGGDGGDW